MNGILSRLKIEKKKTRGVDELCCLLYDFFGDQSQYIKCKSDWLQRIKAVVTDYLKFG
jgi:hypothetical protein